MQRRAARAGAEGTAIMGAGDAAAVMLGGCVDGVMRTGDIQLDVRETRGITRRMPLLRRDRNQRKAS
ncbi:MAG: hypothetical protein J2P49_05925 [Methylocapsa sp.]|nr:hypothetical protein [Methylocapsa sp.]